MFKQLKLIIFLSLNFLASVPILAQLTVKDPKLYKEFSLEVNTDYRYFFNDGLYPRQDNHFASLAIKPEVYLEWADGAQQLRFKGFARIEENNSYRTHWDIRELYWQYIKEDWELSVGLKKIFWGVTESIHLVDIINQTDAVESFDGEEKLGQPMLHFSYVSKLGTFDFFAMPYFRKRAFPGPEGRFRFPLIIEKEDIGFENDNLEEWHPSFAFRFSNTVGPFDVGLSHFYGVGREPVFENNEDLPGFNIFYPINHQTGLDVQAITGPFIWKLEAMLRVNDFQDVFAYATGLEYTFSNIASSGIDIGLIAEYLYDDRGDLAVSGMDNDLFVGSRIAFNDVQSTEILFGGIFDMEKSTRLYSLEASRRFGDSWKLSLEARFLDKVSEREFFNFFREDSFSKVSLSKFF